MNTDATLTLDHDGFLARHEITPDEFKGTNLQWSVLEDICADHQKVSADLLTAANYILQRLQPVSCIHSLKVRIKGLENLAAKVIRNKLKHPERDFTVASYQEHLTDLIGLRALHLFKDDWREIHDFLTSTWDLHEKPIAYVRKGDPEVLQEDFEAAGCDVENHPFGYRSIHYILKFRPDKRTYLAELQVRTIFEEGWSEIDHRIRYPRHSDDEYLADFLRIFNRLSGSADEMGTFIKRLSHFTREQAAKLAERDLEIGRKESALNKAISELEISQGEKEHLIAQVEELKKSSRPFPYLVLGTAAGAATAAGVATAVGSGNLTTGYFLPGVSGVAALTGQPLKVCTACGKPYTEPLNSALTIDDSLKCPDCRCKGPSIQIK
jgi:ppGpp synthetase/RelA/SpoT-type nucleotidyltranferase